MTQRQLESVVGVFVLAGLAVTTVLALYVGGGSFLQRDTREVVARFTSAAGLSVGGRVEVAGVRVGAIRKIELVEDASAAMVTLQVSRTVPLYDDAIASVRTAGLLGARFVALSPGGSGTALPEGMVIVDTESAVDLESIISRFAFGSTGSGGASPAPATP